MLYLSVFVILFYLSFRYDLMGSKTNKDFWYIFMLVVFILIAGLRYRLGEDTPNYLWSFYHKHPSLDKITLSDLSIGNDPFWVLMNSIVKSLGGRFYHVQLIQASFINILIFKYIKKHSSYIFTCLLFYAFTCYTAYNMQIMRASFSIVLCLFANDYFIDKKWIKGYCLILVGFFFHVQTIVMFMMPLLLFMRLNTKGIILLLLGFVAGRILQEAIGDYIFLLEDSEQITDKVEKYTESDYYGTQSDNVNNLLVRFFYDVIYGLLSLWVVKVKIKNYQLLRLEPFVMLGLFFLMVQINFQIVYRFVAYYRIYFVLFYSELFIGFAKKYLRMPCITAYIMMILFFVPYIVLSGYMKKQAFDQYYPYSSVLDKSTTPERQALYRKENRYGKRENEY